MNNQNRELIPAEGDLNDAEKAVLAAFRAGQPQTDSLDEAEIRGDFLRGLFFGRYGETADYLGTRIVGAVISDVLNIEFCETKFPVRFYDCTFAKKIKMQQLKCPELVFYNCTIKRGVDAQSVKVGEDVRMDSSRYDGGINLFGAGIGGKFSCIGVRFHNAGGDAILAQNIKVADGVLLDGGFTAEGRVSFFGADIGGSFSCSDGRFHNAGGDAILAQNIKVADGVLLDGRFTAEGRVSFFGADIGGSFSCSDGRFHNAGGDAILAQNIKVADGVLLDGRFTAEGRASFFGAEIKGQIVCNRCAKMKVFGISKDALS